MTIERELARIYGRTESRWTEEDFADFVDEEREWYDALPEDLRTIAEFLGREDTLPHDDAPVLYGPFDLVEWNGDDGTFGQLREEADYPYPDVVKIGEDLFLDVAGQVDKPGAVVRAIAHDLDGAETVATDLLSLLRAAGSYAS